jgi:hypothetical protein
MSEKQNDNQQTGQPTTSLGRFPGFISEEPMGLGDVIKRVTSTFGIKPCGGCERRAAALNRWIAFTKQVKK